MIIVTGGAGFIGSNIVAALNALGRKDILVVDDLQDGRKFTNLVDLAIEDYCDKDDFLKKIQQNSTFATKIDAIFHEGACSSTTEWDGRFMMQNNYEYSKVLLNYCLAHRIAFIYASSAATYGNGQIFKEERQYEAPLNVYGYSKFLFDEYVRRVLPHAKSQIVGTRYFNVYGPRESHKETMASVAFHFNNQIKESKNVKLFTGTEGYKDGEQRRDFIYVCDAADVNIWFMQHPEHSGIFNVGTGNSQAFNDVAHSVIGWHKKGTVNYIPFPDHLRGRYQSFTQADISALRHLGYDAPFKRVEEGVRLYLDWLNAR